MVTGKKKSYILNEALDYLGNLEVSSSNESKNKDDRKLKSAKDFIQPLLNCNDMNSDLSVLSGNQLLCAVLEINLTNAKVVRGNNDEQNKTNDNHDLAPELKKKKKKNQGSSISINRKHSDLPVIDDFECNLPIPALDSYETLSSLFEKFLADDILQFTCNESVRYAQSKGSHSCKLELQDLKAFIAVLLISGYVDLL